MFPNIAPGLDNAWRGYDIAVPIAPKVNTLPKPSGVGLNYLPLARMPKVNMKPTGSGSCCPGLWRGPVLLL